MANVGTNSIDKSINQFRFHNGFVVRLIPVQ